MFETASSPSIQQRKTWIDIYKGLAILAIVLGHTNYFWPKYVYLFHIAAFFFISGYTVNSTGSFGDFLWKKIKTLILPFVLFNIFFVFINYFVERHNLQLFFTANPNFDLLFLINNILKTHSTVDLGGATWFLIALFVAQVSFQLLLRSLSDYRETKLILAILIPVCLFTTYQLHHGAIRLHFMIDMIPIALAFMIPGYLLHQFQIEKLFSKHHSLLFLWIPLIVVIYWISKNSWIFVDFAGRKFDNPWLIFSHGMIGILLLLSLTKFIEHYLQKISKLIQICGTSSLWIMCLHFLGFRLSYLLLYNLGYLPLEQTTKLVPAKESAHFWAIYTLIAVLFSILCHRTWENFRSCKLQNWTAFCLLLLVGIINFNWLFSPYHFYFADDFDHLSKWIQKDWSHFASFIPQTMYNDRPFGQVFYKILAEYLGSNYRSQHFVIFLIYIFNGWLFYQVSKKLTKNSNQSASKITILVAILFTIWPQTNIPAQWISAAFDLLGATFVLCYLLVYFSVPLSKFKIWRSLLLVFLVIAMARTKEATLLIPFVTMLLDIYIVQKDFAQIKYQKIISIINSNIIPVTIAFSYIVYLVYLKSQSDMGFQQLNHPYYSSLNPINILTNYFKYLYLFFYFDASGQAFQGLTSIGIVWVSLAITILTIPIALYGQGWQRITGAYFLILFLLVLLPVLPLVNMQHELYLYIPSIFIFLGLGLSLSQILDQQPAFVNPARAILTICLSLLLYYNTFSINMSSQISWYLGLGSENTKVFQALQKAEIPDRIRTINIYNIDFPDNILQFGAGKAALQLALGKDYPELTVNLFTEQAVDKLRDKKTININYQKLRQGILKMRAR